MATGFGDFLNTGALLWDLAQLVVSRLLVPNLQPKAGLPSLPQWRKAGDVTVGRVRVATSQLTISLMWSKGTWCHKARRTDPGQAEQEDKALVPLPCRVHDEKI